MKKITAYNRGLVRNKHALISGVVIGGLYGMTSWDAGIDRATAASFIYFVAFVVGIWLARYEQRAIIHFFIWWSRIIEHRWGNVRSRILESIPELADKIDDDHADSLSLVRHGFTVFYAALNAATISIIMCLLWSQIDPVQAETFLTVSIYWCTAASALVGMQAASYADVHWRVKMLGRRLDRADLPPERPIIRLVRGVKRVSNIGGETTISAWLRRMGFDDGTPLLRS